MKINRKDLLRTLKTSATATTKQEVIEQSDCFVFTKDELITFNDEILIRSQNPLKTSREFAIPVTDFTKMLSKFPDDEVVIRLRENEIEIKGTRRTAGLSIQAEIFLQHDAVPKATKWRRIPKGVPALLQQAARACGRDLSNPLTTMIHVTKTMIEACDNFRLFRAEVEKTGFLHDVIIPAASMMVLDGLVLVRSSLVGNVKGWVHFQTDTGHVFSLRCQQGEYANVEPILKMKTSESVTLPANLGEIVSRAEVMATDQQGSNPLVGVSIENKMLILTARKEGGWFKERKKIQYSGPPIAFEVAPRFLVDVLEKTRKVRIGDGKMKLQTDNTQFVVCLEV